MTHKLAIRSAWLVGKDADERVEAYDAVRRFYKVRSAVIHGNWRKRKRRKRPIAREEVEQAARQGYATGRDVLVALLERGGFPDWKKVSLSAE